MLEEAIVGKGLWKLERYKRVEDQHGESQG